MRLLRVEAWSGLFSEPLESPCMGKLVVHGIITNQIALWRYFFVNAQFMCIAESPEIVFATLRQRQRRVEEYEEE
jgi:hypothetical protein